MVEQIKKYIRGNKERGHEVIAELEKLGGKNILNFKGDEYDKVYYIGRYIPNDNMITIVSEKSFIGQLIVTHPDWEEIELPKYKYPSTYEECCKVMNYCYNPKSVRTNHKEELIRKFQFLLLYRDAYWKIAGDWKPDWAMYSGPKHCIIYSDNEIKWQGKHFVTEAKVLAFPTAEMRDAFYENFKELIELVKELL